MAFPAKTRVLFETGDDAADGGGTIRDQAVHTSFQIDFEPREPYGRITIPLDNGLDKAVEVKLYGRTEKTGDKWHQLGVKVDLAAGTDANPKQDEMTLMDWWRSLKLTVETSVAADPTAGNFLAKLMPIIGG